METRLKLSLVALLCSFFSTQSFAQKNLISDQKEIISTAAQVFTTAMEEGGDLDLLAKENNFTGAYVIDITIRNKGEVASVFVVNRDGGSIEVQNMLTDYIKEMKMGFKMPKNKSYKFRYQFNFNK